MAVKIFRWGNPCLRPPTLGGWCYWQLNMVWPEVARCFKVRLDFGSTQLKLAHADLLEWKWTS